MTLTLVSNEADESRMAFLRFKGEIHAESDKNFGDWG
jgi:hypothetical protein